LRDFGFTSKGKGGSNGRQKGIPKECPFLFLGARISAMDITTETNITKIINRVCAVCGKEISVIIHSDKIYSGGHYFGKLGNNRIQKAEYWECQSCFDL